MKNRDVLSQKKLKPVKKQKGKMGEKKNVKGTEKCMGRKIEITHTARANHQKEDSTNKRLIKIGEVKA